MVAVSRIIFIIVCIFFLIFYFFVLPLPKIFSEYENYKQKQLILNSLIEDNKLMEKCLSEIDNNNSESLKYVLYQKDSNEIFIKFPEKGKVINKYSIKDKNLFILLYYIIGVLIFSIIFINIISSEQAVYQIPQKQRKRTKYYYQEN